jgi:hypothetical protein
VKVNLNFKHVRYILLSISYLMSLLCFLRSNVFEHIRELSGSIPVALVIINTVSLVYILLGAITPMRAFQYKSVPSILLLIPVVLAESKLNWLDTVFHLKFSSTLPTIVTGLISFTALIVCLLEVLTVKLEARMEQLTERGAGGDLHRVYRRQLSVYGHMVLLTLAPAIPVVLIGFLLLGAIKPGVGPNMFLISGIGLCAASLVTGMMVLYRRQKNGSGE